MTCSASCIKNNKQVGLCPLGSEHGFHLAVLAGTLFVLLRKYSLALSLILSLAAWQLFPPMHYGLFKLMYLLQHYVLLALVISEERIQSRESTEAVYLAKQSKRRKEIETECPKGG